MNIIDQKINKLRDLTSNFIFVEYYSHLNGDCYKIKDEFTHHNELKLVLCNVEEGIEKALDLAITALTENKKEFYGTK